jgi:ADP-heptose:LPS heptosyltransferase
VRRRAHVLYARLDNDGDVLLQGPAVRAVARGAERVTLLCGPRGRAAAALLPGVDEILVHRAPWIDPDPGPVSAAAERRLVDAVRARAVDAAIVSTSDHQSALPLALLLRFAGVGFIAAISEDYPGSLLDVRHRDPGDVHEVERALGLAAAAGFPPPPGDDAALRLARTGPRPPGLPDEPYADEPYVVVHPGTSVSARAWPAEHHRALVARLAAQGRHVVVTGAPDERALTAFVAGRPSRDGGPAPPAGAGTAATRPPAGVTDLGGRTDLAQLAAVIAGAEALVVGNTGPAHLAAAVGTPVVSLHAPTVPAARWRPWQVPHALLETDVPCAGCRARTCPVPGHPCLTAIAPSEVEDAVTRLALVRA